MPSTLKAAVLASVLPQCLALAIGSFGDDVAAPAVAMPEDLETDVYWGDKHNRLRYTPETFDGEVELMIRDLGIYADADVIEKRQDNGTMTSSVSAPVITAAPGSSNVTANGFNKTTSTKKKRTTTSKTSTRKSTTMKSSTRRSSTKATSAATVAGSVAPPPSSSYPAGAAQATAINTPSVVTYTLLGAPTHDPELSYISGQKPTPLPTLASNYLMPQATVEAFLANKAINSNTGTLVIDGSNEGQLAALNGRPNYSRDQGKGGTIGDTSFFVFADTLTYSPGNPGTFTGAVSNSIALDFGMNPAQGQALQIGDPMGAYSGPNGALRGFVPFTNGESYFNGHSKGRIAIWPESSIIPLTGTSAIQYAPIVLINGTGYHYAGTTMYEISIPSKGGPVANRVATRLFDTTSGVEWGCLGGLRSYSSDGETGGNVYILGNHKGGLMIGRAPIDSASDASAYTYWEGGNSWTATQPGKTSTTNTFLGGAFSTVDIFYSPRHLTFIAVYMDEYTDNDFYAHYLNGPPILPSWAGGPEADIVQYLTQYTWSKQFLIFQTTAISTNNYNYGGGMNMGYFGAEDITRGGNKMLLHWDHPTGNNAASTDTGFELQSAVVEWN